jgi:hypothetical protein
VHAAQEKLESEIRLFERGESTNFLVLTRQNENADSRHRRLVTNLDMNKAVVRVEQALGTMLADHNITLKYNQLNPKSTTSRPQTIQQESLRIHKVLQTSTGFGIWFGTRRSGVCR